MKTQSFVHPRTRAENRSQALAEFAMVLPIFLTLMCGVFDYGWMIGNSNTLATAAREAANTAARQNTDPVVRGLESAINVSRPRLDMASDKGGVIVTQVVYDPTDDTNFVSVVDPLAENCMSTGTMYGGGDNLKNKSRILIGANAWDTSQYRQLPFDADNLAPNQTMIVAEVFYTNEFVTPIGTLIGMLTPDRLYDAAFF